MDSPHKLRVRIVAEGLGTFLVPVLVSASIADFRKLVEQRLAKKAVEKGVADGVLVSAVRSLGELDDEDLVGDVLRDAEDVFPTLSFVNPRTTASALPEVTAEAAATVPQARVGDRSDSRVAEPRRLLKDEQFTASFTSCTAILDSSPALSGRERAEVLCLRARAGLGLERYRKAIEDCKAAASSDPSSLEAFLLHGDALVGIGKITDALMLWRAGIDAVTNGVMLDSDSKVILDMLHQRMITHGSKVAASAPAPAPAPAPTPAPAPAPAPASKPVATVGPQEAATATIAKPSSALSTPVLERIQQAVLVGNSCVNSGQHDKAIAVFNIVLKEHPTVIEAYLGRGSAYAMSNHFDEALSDFTSAIRIDAKHPDAYKRRGQVLAALGKFKESVADLTKSAALSPGEADTINQRGHVFFKWQDFKKALVDFETVTAMAPQEAEGWLMRGQTLNQLGLCPEAVEAYDRALQLQPKNVDAWMQRAQAMKNYGDGDGAEDSFARALRVDPNHLPTLNLRQLYYHGVGRPVDCLADASRGLRAHSTDEHSLFMAAVSHHSMGQYSLALARYNELFAMKPDHLGFCQREIAIVQCQQLDSPFRESCLDALLERELKEGFAKRWGRSQLPPTYNLKKANALRPDVAVVPLDPASPRGRLIAFADEIGTMMQYNSPGFLKNTRQYRQFGLAALEVAQLCLKVWRGGLGGVTVSDPASSLPSFWKSRRSHIVTARDVYDVAVRWRQMSEPFDPVFYIDGLTRTAFEEGFGLQTPLVSGQNFVVRYYPQFAAAFPLTQRLIAEQCPLTDDMRAAVLSSKTCDEVYDVIRRDFWVVTPCHSTAVPGRVMEGTRLTIQYKPPNGYEYTIRTPGTPTRWVHFEEELQWFWTALCSEMTKPKTEESLHRVAHLVLGSYFYWVNMGPLTRGSAAVGLCVLVGMALACGLPLDWNGILTASPAEFAANAMPIVFRELHEGSPFEALEIGDFADVAETFVTWRHVVEALNASVLSS